MRAKEPSILVPPSMTMPVPILPGRAICGCKHPHRSINTHLVAIAGHSSLPHPVGPSLLGTINCFVWTPPTTISGGPMIPHSLHLLLGHLPIGCVYLPVSADNSLSISI